MCRIKGGRDPCVKLGLDTPGEGRPLPAPRMVCDCNCCVHAQVCKCLLICGLRLSFCACVSYPVQNVTGGRFSSKKRLDTLSKRQSKPNTPRSSLCLHPRIRLCLSAKRRGLERRRKHTELQSARLSLFLWNAYRGLSRSACRSQVWPRVWWALRPANAVALSCLCVDAYTRRSLCAHVFTLKPDKRKLLSEQSRSLSGGCKVTPVMTAMSDWKTEKKKKKTSLWGYSQKSCFPHFRV